MTQIFSEDGVLTPVTVLQAGPCVVTQVKTVENDGYSAIQVGYGDIREKLVNKPETGHFKKAGVPVLAKVAAIFDPICPDFPTPVTTIFPLQA